MSFFLPYTPTDVINYFSTLFTIDLSSLTNYETMLLTLFSNLYFFVFWFFIIYFAYKLFNHLWERIC